MPKPDYFFRYSFRYFLRYFLRYFSRVRNRSYYTKPNTPRPTPPAASPFAMPKAAYKAQRSKAVPEDLRLDDRGKTAAGYCLGLVGISRSVARGLTSRAPKDPRRI